MSKVGFIGLGVMGGPMAGHLLEGGFELAIWNRTPEKADLLIGRGAQWCSSPQELAENCDAVMLCLRGSEDVAQITHLLLESKQEGLIIVDHSTIEPGATIELSSRCQGQKCEFVDAPITGGSMGAKNGTLTIFCGGSESAFETVLPYLNCYAKRAEYVGVSGQGQVTKLANQIAVAGALIGLCESMAFAKKAGLNLEQTHSLLSSGAAGSWAFDNYGPKLLKQDWTPGFSIDNQVKDLVYAHKHAEEIGQPIPMSDLVESLLQRLIHQGRGQDTTAALYDALLELVE